MICKHERVVTRRQSGMTLIEILIVVVIITILAAVGYPSYGTYITRANRQAAKNVIYRVADLQEQFFLDNRAYAADLTAFGFAAATIGLDDKGQLTTSGAADRRYTVTMTNNTATTYTVEAAPALLQAQRDTECGTLSLTHTGERDQTGAGTNCW